MKKWVRVLGVNIVVVAIAIGWLMSSAGTAYAQQAACVVTRAEGFKQDEDARDVIAGVARDICAELLRNAPSIYAMELTRSTNGLHVVVLVLDVNGISHRHEAQAAGSARGDEGHVAGRQLVEAMSNETLIVGETGDEKNAPTVVIGNTVITTIPTPAPAQAPPPTEDSDEQHANARNAQTSTMALFSAAAAFGPTLETLYGIRMFGIELTGSLGFMKGNFAGSMFGGVGRAKTEYGRRTDSYEVGVSVEAILHRFRLGGAWSIRTLTIDSVTSMPERSGYGMAISALASFDLVPIGRHAAFIAARGAIDSVAGDKLTLTPIMRLSLGLRF